jgi:predicted dinucleotide-binding enzyme
MKVAIIGTGNLGGTLGTAFAKVGYEVQFGTRNPDSAHHEALKQATGATFTTITEAVQASEMILLVTPWHAAEEVVRSIADWEGKILVDCTNPIKSDFSGLRDDEPFSGAERIARWANKARVVKCFNQTGYENMGNPVIAGERTVMFAAGDDEAAVNDVTEAVGRLGFEAINAGSLRVSQQLEQLGWLWIHLAVKQGIGRQFGFAMLHR